MVYAASWGFDLSLYVLQSFVLQLVENRFLVILVRVHVFEVVDGLALGLVVLLRQEFCRLVAQLEHELALIFSDLLEVHVVE